MGLEPTGTILGARAGRTRRSGHMWRGLPPAMGVVIGLVVGLGLVGCGTTQVDLQYAGPVNASPAAAGAAVQVATFQDKRGEPPTWLGAIRGGFGNPLKSLESSRPVSEIVTRAFTQALQHRRVATTGGAVQLSGVVRKLECNQVLQREAIAEIEVTVGSATAAKPAFTKVYAVTKTESAGLSSGVLASTDDLRKLTEQALREVVDKALDDPALRAALRG